MFCTQCGSRAAENAVFCTNCGYRFRNNARAENGAAVIPCYLMTGILSEEPAVLWLDRERCAFIRVGKSLYDSVTREASYVPKRVPREKAMMHAFREYAEGLRGQSLDALINQYPGSVAFSTDGIKSFALVEEYDQGLHAVTGITFKLKTDAGTYRAGFDRHLELGTYYQPMLKAYLQDRYRYRERTNPHAW